MAHQAIPKARRRWRLNRESPNGETHPLSPTSRARRADPALVSPPIPGETTSIGAGRFFLAPEVRSSRAGIIADAPLVLGLATPCSATTPWG